MDDNVESQQQVIGFLFIDKIITFFFPKEILKMVKLKKENY